LSLSIFSSIYEGFITWFGAMWIVWLILGIAFLVIITQVLRVPLVIALVVGMIPFIMLMIYGIINTGSNIATALVAVFLALLIALGMIRIFNR
jgi:hypothetical protein